MIKSLHRLLIMLIFVFVSASAYLFSTKTNQTAVSEISNPTSTPKINIQPEEVKPSVLKRTESSLVPNKKIGTPLSTTTSPSGHPTSSPATDDPTETVSTTFTIDNTKYAIKVKPGTTAFEGMIKLKESNQISFSAKKFSGLGYFIEEINGIKNSPSTGFYWTLYINNQEAKIGVSNYILKPNDIITWRYMRK
jgi:hypothetical protein